MDLFDLPDPPAYHASDPDTSRAALDSIEESGARARNQRIVFALVRENPGCTAVELWEYAPTAIRDQLKEMQEVRRRLCDLEGKGLVVKGQSRHCRKRGTRQVTWVPFSA